jgi:hypothetical protein
MQTCSAHLVKVERRYPLLPFKILLFIAICPGVLLFSTEIGLSQQIQITNGSPLILAEVFKIAWTVCAVFAVLFFMPISKREVQIPLLLLPFSLISMLVWADIETAEPDGGYAFFWMLFIWIFLYLLRRHPQPWRISVFLMFFSIVDQALTIAFTQGGGIFHQHRFSGVTLLAIMVGFYGVVVRRGCLLYGWRVALVMISATAIVTTITIHQTRQMLPYALATFFLALAQPERSLAVPSLKGFWVASLIIMILGFAVILNHSGLVGNILYDVSSVFFSAKDRHIEAEGGREALFLALINFIESEKLSWLGPVSVAKIYLGGAISSHNLWLESYFRYGLLYVAALFVLLLWMVRAALIVLRAIKGSVRIFLPLVVISWLWILQANDEGFIQTRAPLISLFWIPILAMYLDSRNQTPLISPLHGLKRPRRSAT